MENWIGGILILAVIGWIFYRKTTDKPIIPSRGGSKGGRKLR